MAAKAENAGIGAAELTERIDSFLASRGIKPASGPGEVKSPDHQITKSPDPASPDPAEFVCEADVREAIAQKRKITLGEKTIVTPAARELGEAHKIFVQAVWRG